MSNASPMPVRFTRQNAITQVERMHGGIEGFIGVIAEEFPGFLDGDHISPEVIAGALGIPTPVFLQVINSNAYQTALDSYAAGVAYNLQARIRAMNVLKEVATGGQKLVMSPKGDAVYVDRDTSEIIAADKHLRSLQGRPIETGKGAQAAGITIQFGDTVNREETHQHVHITSEGNAIPERQPNPLGYLGRPNNTGGRNHPQLGGTPEASDSTAWSSEGQPESNAMGSHVHPRGTGDTHGNNDADQQAYKPPQPGSGPPAGQARAYARASSSKPFQSHDAEIIDGSAPGSSPTAHKPQIEHMDKAERIRRVGFGLHQTPPTATTGRQAKGTDETPGEFQDFLGGDTPITPLPRTQVGGDAIEAQERRARTFQGNKEDKLRRYLSGRPLIDRDEDD